MNEVNSAWSEVRAGLLSWNFHRAEQAFHEFCSAHEVPDWFEDEYAFAGMQLWAAGRASSALRHFAVFFDKAAGRPGPGLWDPQDGAMLAEAEPLAFA